MSILVVFAAFASIGFTKGLAALLWMSIILCAVIGTMRREQPFGAALNHWDETWPTRRCSPWSPASIIMSRPETASRDPIRRL